MKPIDLSKQIEVAPDTAARISRGETNLTLSTVVKLMRLFGVTRIDDLVEFQPDEP